MFNFDRHGSRVNSKVNWLRQLNWIMLERYVRGHTPISTLVHTTEYYTNWGLMHSYVFSYFRVTAISSKRSLNTGRLPPCNQLKWQRCSLAVIMAGIYCAWFQQVHRGIHTPRELCAAAMRSKNHVTLFCWVRPLFVICVFTEAAVTWCRIRIGVTSN
jgi:hypothetical protein